MPNRIDSSLDIILNRIVARLREQIEGANEANCYVSDDPDGLPAGNSSQFIYVVSPAPSGRFNEGMFDGGGTLQATVDTVLTVTVHSTAMNDQPHRAEQFFLNESRGLFASKASPVLKALAGHDLTDQEGDWILTQPIIPLDYNWERPNQKKGSVQFGFRIMFDWKLT